MLAAFDFLSFGLGIVVGGPLTVGGGLLYAHWLHNRRERRRSPIFFDQRAIDIYNQHTFYVPPPPGGYPSMPPPLAESTTMEPTDDRAEPDAPSP